jgi:hypothetical protein
MVFHGYFMVISEPPYILFVVIMVIMVTDPDFAYIFSTHIFH